MVTSVTIGYEYNEGIPECIENQLLRSIEYEDRATKEKYLVDYLGRVLPSITTFYSAATGVNICTTDDGDVVHTVF
jgi:hypothetical protein